MTQLEIHVVETGIANRASVEAGIRRAGFQPRSAGTRLEIQQAERLILPGVGAFAPAMERLRANGLDQALRERIREGRPTLAICLGLQLLSQSSEESPGTPGIGVFPDGVVRLRETLPVPHMGWNRVTPAGDCTLLEEGDAYFANSYMLPTVPEGWTGAWTEYGTAFVCALQRGAVLACQFHPELSGSWGQRLSRGCSCRC